MDHPLEISSQPTSHSLCLLLQNVEVSGCDLTVFFLFGKTPGLEEFYKVIFSQNQLAGTAYSGGSKLAGAGMIAWANNRGQEILNPLLLV